MLPDHVGNSENMDSASWTMKLDLHCYNALNTPPCSSHFNGECTCFMTVHLVNYSELLRHTCDYIVLSCSTYIMIYVCIIILIFSNQNPSAVQSLIEKFQKGEMDGKPAVSSKPARTFRSTPLVCQFPEPCVQDEEQLQMVGWYNPRQHTTAIYMWLEYRSSCLHAC